MDTMELLPPPPFDLDKEPLVDGSVELHADRLKGTVAWLVDCIRQQQKQLQAHDSLLSDAAAGGSRPASTAKEGSAGQVPQSLPKSVTQQLQSAMQDELLSMQVTKMQHELNTLPRIADLDRQRDLLLTDLSTLSNKTDQSLKDAEDKLHSELGSATDELRQRLERIGDDLLQRLDDLEKRTAGAEAVATAAKEEAANNEKRLSSRIESVQAEAEASMSRAASKLDDALLAGSLSRANDARPASSTSSKEKAAAAADPPKQEAAQGPVAAAAAPVAAPSVQRQPTPPASLPAAALAQQQSSTAAGEAERLASAAAVSNFLGIVTELQKNVASCQASTTKMEGVFDEIVSNIEHLRERFDEEQHHIMEFEEDFDGLKAELEEELDGLKAQVEDVVGHIGDNAATSSELNALRKQWLERAACRQPGSRTASGKVSNASTKSGRLTRQGSTRVRTPTSPNRPANRPALGSGLSSRRLGTPDKRPPSTSAVSCGSGRIDEEPVLPEPVDLSDVYSKIEKLDKSLLMLQQDHHHDAAEKQLEEKINELREIMFPANKPSLGETVTNCQKIAVEIQKSQKDAEKRIRRIAPLDSEFADVQNELERFRKLFEFVEKILPPDASKAMSFFNRHDNEKADLTLIDGKKRKPNQTVETQVTKSLTDNIANTLGPEVAFEHQRDQLTAEIRNHEEAMRNDFANLTTVIKALQREMQQTSGKTGDLIDRLGRVEKNVTTARVAAAPAQTTTQASDVDSPAPEPEPTSQTGPETGPSEDGVDRRYITKNGMAAALERTKNDIRSWLDALHSSLISGLQQKVDTTQLRQVLSQMQKGTGADGEHFAMLATRGLYGRCASCDAQMNAELAGAKRPPPVSKPPAWPVQPGPTPGPAQIRPPAALATAQFAVAAPASTAAKLPKILDARSANGFSKGKMYKNSSQPELRQVHRTLEQDER